MRYTPVLLMMACGGKPPEGFPSADCSASDLAVALGTIVTVDGSGSAGATSEDAVSFAWSLTEAPSDSAASLLGTDGSTTSFQADVEGSYTVELTVTSEANGETDTCSATIEAGDTDVDTDSDTDTDVQPEAPVEIHLEWTLAGDDLDLHLVLGDGQVNTPADCNYQTCLPPNGAEWGDAESTADNPVMIADDIPGTGPEIIRIARIEDATYRVVVHDYPASVANETNSATITVWVGETRWSVTKRITGEDSWTDVVSFNPSTETFTPL